MNGPITRIIYDTEDTTLSKQMFVHSLVDVLTGKASFPCKLTKSRLTSMIRPPN
jgi:hypothetical protein